MPMRVAIYTRVSRLEASPGDSCARQEKLCRRWASEHAMTVARVFTDEALTAYRPGVHRKSFEVLLRALGSSEFDVVVARDVSRYVRTIGDFERLLAACRSSNTLLRSANEEIDAVEPSKVLHGRIKALISHAESEAKSFRLADLEQDRAERGIPPRSGVYGLTKDCSQIIESEAALVRELVRRVNNGERVKAIAADWNTRGEPRRDTKPWRDHHLRNLARNPGIVGDRAYKGQVVATGCWPAIVDRLDAAMARNQISGGSRNGQHQPRRYLLQGLVTCGSCGGRMAGAAGGSTDSSYVCRGDKHCRAPMRITQTQLHTWVTGAVLSRLAIRRPRNNRRPWPQADLSAAIRALEKESDALRVINSMYVMRAEITKREWQQLRDLLAHSTSQQLARSGLPPRVQGLSRDFPLSRLSDRWHELDLMTQRDVIRMELGHVVIHRPINRQWHPDRIVATWLLPDPAGWTQDPTAPKNRPRLPEPMWVNHRTDKRRVPAVGLQAGPALRARGGLMNTAEATVVTGLSAYRVEQGYLHGLIPRVRVDGRWCYHLADLDQLETLLNTKHETERLARIEVQRAHRQRAETTRPPRPPRR